MSIFYFYPVLRALSNGGIIRKVVAIVLRVVSILTVLGGCYLLVELLKFVFQPQVPTEVAAGGLLFGIIFLATILAIGQIFWYRADSVRDLGESRYTAMPIVSILLRAIGEVYATLAAAVGLGGCLFIWFARTSPDVLLRGLREILPSAGAGETFLGGLKVLATMGIASFGVLIFFYFLAESVIVMVDMAGQIRLLVRQAPASAAPAAPAAPRCPRCLVELEPGTRFCGTCGTPITS
jgi:hypothetical protein